MLARTLSLLGWLDEKNRDGISKFQNLIHAYFHVIHSLLGEFDLAEHGDIRGAIGRFPKLELHFAFAQDGGLIGTEQPALFNKLADPGGPSIEQAQFKGRDGDAGDTDGIDDADNEKITVGFLANIFAKEAGLEVGKNSVWIHGCEWGMEGEADSAA